MQILNNEIIKSVVNSFYIKCKKYIILNKIYHLILLLIPKEDGLIWKNFIYNPIVKIQFDIAKFYFHKKKQ